jgi:DNA-binding XRE family transcriptional regulator
LALEALLAIVDQCSTGEAATLSQPDARVGAIEAASSSVCLAVDDTLLARRGAVAGVPIVGRRRESPRGSQEQLADEAGLHRTYVSGIERCVRNPTLLILERLAKALKLAPHALLEP